MSESLDVHAKKLLGHGFGHLSKSQQRVIRQVVARASVARDLSSDNQETTFGQRLADRVAAVGGSWAFIIVFGIVLTLWVAANGYLLAVAGLKPFDPYPFIFLNLILSMLAAVQAPVIMMSQNRQAVKDRVAAQHDYEVNLKAELEILSLHEKLDALRSSEIANLLTQQTVLLEELKRRGDAEAARAEQ